LGKREVRKGVAINFQNLPARDPEAAAVVRRAFIPKRGAFSSFDYEQIEPRLFAYYVSKGLGDPTIADWFREGRDFYREIASKVYGRPVDQITDEERQEGKVWYLMILYSAGPKKIAAEIGMPYSEAKEFYLQFHEGLPQIKLLSNPEPSSARGWHDYQPGLIERTLRNRKYLKTPWGRHLHPEQWGEFKMLNKLIQGSAADLMKLAIVKVAQHIRVSDEYGTMGMLGDERNLPLESRLVLTVHDELVLDGPENEINALHELVPAQMIDDEINAVVPLGVDHEISTTNLAEKVSYDEWKETHGNSGNAAERSGAAA
jgi:DNA polymerase-1